MLNLSDALSTSGSEVQSGERVQCEPLTDVMNLLPLWQQESVQLRLARQMQALCICAKELLAEYSVQPPGISTQRSLLYANGIPPVLHDATRCVGLASWSDLLSTCDVHKPLFCAFPYVHWFLIVCQFECYQWCLTHHVWPALSN